VTKVGRNEPCPCGSGRKWKKCHLLEQKAEKVALEEQRQESHATRRSGPPVLSRAKLMMLAAQMLALYEPPGSGRTHGLTSTREDVEKSLSEARKKSGKDGGA
jgi:hypothetical protein